MGFGQDFLFLFFMKMVNGILPHSYQMNTEEKKIKLARNGNNILVENNNELLKLHRWGPLAPWWAETQIKSHEEEAAVIVNQQQQE